MGVIPTIQGTLKAHGCKWQRGAMRANAYRGKTQVTVTVVTGERKVSPRTDVEISQTGLQATWIPNSSLISLTPVTVAKAVP